MSAPRAKRVALAADGAGIGALRRHVPRGRIACVVAASRRPQYLEQLQAVAAALGVPLLVQPPRGDASFAQFSRSLAALGTDLLVCHSYSMIFPCEVLDAVAGNAVNVHAALLPKNRGPNPVQWCLIRGESVTGVTLHFMGEEADEGDIIAQRRISISDEDTWVTLNRRCDAEAEALLAEFLPLVLEGTAPRTAQSAHEATRNRRLTPDFPRIHWARMADRDVFNLIRAQVAPLGGAFFERDGTRVVVDHYLPLLEVASLRYRHV